MNEERICVDDFFDLQKCRWKSLTDIFHEYRMRKTWYLRVIVDAKTWCVDLVAFPWNMRYGHQRASSETGHGVPPFFNGGGDPQDITKHLELFKNIIGKKAAGF